MAFFDATGLRQVRADELGHFKHGDLWLTKDDFQLVIGIDVALVRRILQVVFLMYSQIFFVTSVRGMGVAPMTAANSGLMFMGFMNAALGARFAGAAFFAVAIFRLSYER